MHGNQEEEEELAALALALVLRPRLPLPSLLWPLLLPLRLPPPLEARRRRKKKRPVFALPSHTSKRAEQLALTAGKWASVSAAPGPHVAHDGPSAGLPGASGENSSQLAARRRRSRFPFYLVERPAGQTCKQTDTDLRPAAPRTDGSLTCGSRWPLAPVAARRPPR